MLKKINPPMNTDKNMKREVKMSIIVAPGGWEETLPEWLLKDLKKGIPSRILG